MTKPEPGSDQDDRGTGKAQGARTDRAAEAKGGRTATPPPYEPPKVTKFEKLSKLIVSGE